MNCEAAFWEAVAEAKAEQQFHEELLAMVAECEEQE